MIPDVKVEMYLNSHKDKQEAGVSAYGNVTINNAIRFPIQLRSYTDKNTGEEKSFFSYPRRYVNGEWKNVVTPDPKLKEEIERKVGEACKELVLKDLTLMNKFDDIKIISINQVKNIHNHGNVTTVGMATINVSGLTIDGISIKRGEKGLFINMPQYQSQKGFRDQVYGIDKYTQEWISKAVIEEYEEKYIGKPKLNLNEVYNEYFSDEKDDMNESVIHYEKNETKMLPKI